MCTLQILKTQDLVRTLHIRDISSSVAFCVAFCVAVTTLTCLVLDDFSLILTAHTDVGVVLRASGPKPAARYLM